jgi:hypothetical protein
MERVSYRSRSPVRQADRGRITGHISAVLPQKIRNVLEKEFVFTHSGMRPFASSLGIDLPFWF